MYTIFEEGIFSIFTICKEGVFSRIPLFHSHFHSRLLTTSEKSKIPSAHAHSLPARIMAALWPSPRRSASSSRGLLLDRARRLNGQMKESWLVTPPVLIVVCYFQKFTVWEKTKQLFILASVCWTWTSSWCCSSTWWASPCSPPPWTGPSATPRTTSATPTAIWYW